MLRDGDLQLPPQVLARHRALAAGDVGGRALGHDSPAPHARPRAEIDDGIGRQHRVLVMLDHDHGVAHVPQVLEGPEKTRVVPVVQAYRGLVEDVEHAHQPAADLARQADPLRLAARQCRRRPVERQVVQPHVEQEAQPRIDLLQRVFGDHGLLRRQRQPLEERLRIADGQPAEVRDRHAPQRHRQALPSQPTSIALGAHAVSHHRLEVPPPSGRRALMVPPG